MILRLLVVLIGLVLTAQQTFAWHRELQESKAMVDLHKLLHTRQEKIKAFPRLHRSVLATSHEARRCPTDSFVLITEFQYGQAGNQLVEFTHGLWLADKLNATLVVPEYMGPILAPFHLHEIKKLFCFSDEAQYKSSKAEKEQDNVKVKIYELESEDSFWLQNIMGKNDHAKQFPSLPPLEKKVVDEISLYFLDVYASLWGHAKPIIMQEACRIIAHKMKHSIKFTAVHKRDMEGGCQQLFWSNLPTEKCGYLSDQVPLNSSVWQIAGSSSFCRMDAVFVSDTMKMHNREMKRNSDGRPSSHTAQPVYLAWDGKGSIDSWKALSAEFVLSADYRSNHDASELKESGIHHSDSLLKFVDMYMAIHSDLFVLNPRSTFSFEIYAIRTILGLESVPVLKDKDLYMLKGSQYLKKRAQGSSDWDGHWVSWTSITDARNRAMNPLNIHHVGTGF